MSIPIYLLIDNKAFMQDPKEHHRQQKKIARHQHIKQTLQLPCESEGLFLVDNSITLDKDKYISLAKGDTDNAKHTVIGSAHARHDKPSISFAQHSRNNA